MSTRNVRAMKARWGKSPKHQVTRPAQPQVAHVHAFTRYVGENYVGTSVRSRFACVCGATELHP